MADETDLHARIASVTNSLILSTWHHNDFRRNIHLDRLWAGFQILTRKHFYHVGASENNRHAMVEALVTNIAQTPMTMSEKGGNEQCALFV